MNLFTFILLSLIYVISLAIVDGIFNRLVFREYKKLSYSSKEKQEIYNLPEWRTIGVFLLILLPVVIPVSASFLIGGVRFVFIYLIVLMLVPWDIIFGKLVFNDWFGDTPSIALPLLGWKSVSLKNVILLRIFGILILFLIFVIV